MMDLIPSSLVWKVGNVGVQLFLGCIRSQMAKESISSMPDLGRRPSLSILFSLDVVATTKFSKTKTDRRDEGAP